MAKHHEHKKHLTERKWKWWQWVAMGLMLAAIGTYVLTLDDSVVPEEKVVSSEVPATAAPAPRR
jgi:hypothetical protein